MKVFEILSESDYNEQELKAQIKDLYSQFEQVKEHFDDEDSETWDKYADYLDLGMEYGELGQAAGWLNRLEMIVDRYKGIGECCEEIWVGANDEVLTEAAQRAFKRIGKEIKRKYRCTTGMKKGRVVADPIQCATRKDPRKVRHGRKIARTKKGIRIRKSKIMKRTAMSKMVSRMNARLSGKTAKKSAPKKSATKKAKGTKKTK